MNAKDRLNHYATALEFYCRSLLDGVFDRAVYVDNSGYALDELIAIARSAGVEKRIEFISYKSTVDPNKSRYFLEINLIDHAIRTSQLLNQGDPIIWKISGRYIVRNCDKIVASWPCGANLYANFRDRPYPLVDFFFIGFRRSAYARSIGAAISDFAVTEDGEKLLRKQIEAGAFEGLTIARRFRTLPRLQGVRGFDGSRYDGLSGTAKYYVRWVAARIFPNLWI